MPPTIESLGLDQIPVADRLDSTNGSSRDSPHDASPGLTEGQIRELRRRVAEADANPDDLIPWEQVKAETNARMHP